MKSKNLKYIFSLLVSSKENTGQVIHRADMYAVVDKKGRLFFSWTLKGVDYHDNPMLHC